MAFGSLILALISVVRIVLEYIDDQTKDVQAARRSQQPPRPPTVPSARLRAPHRLSPAAQDANILLKYALKCCKCFLMCFEKSIKFLTSYAYTFVILENRGFCSACYMSYTLLGEYATQIAINKMVCFVLYWIQSIVTPIVCFLCAYKQMTMNDEKIQTGAGPRPPRRRPTDPRPTAPTAPLRPPPPPPLPPLQAQPMRTTTTGRSCRRRPSSSSPSCSRAPSPPCTSRR